MAEISIEHYTVPQKRCSVCEKMIGGMGAYRKCGCDPAHCVDGTVDVVHTFLYYTAGVGHGSWADKEWKDVYWLG